MNILACVDRLERERDLSDAEFAALIKCEDPEALEYLFARARAVRDAQYGRKVYIRGLIEYSNYCKNDCLYCGIRRSNRGAERYRLSEGQILDCCRAGYALGFRTFVLQGGEDPYFTDERAVSIVSAIRREFPDCAITLAHRVQCLRDLKAIGYQTGTGMMVGSPFQTADCLVRDLRFIQELQPQMVGIGPFIPHHDTPFARYPAGTARQTLTLLAMLRLMLPCALLPATTALGTIDGDGREKGMNAGCNVVMPNLSPRDCRSKYLLYDNKIATGDEAAESLNSLKKRMERAGYEIVTDRGDYRDA